MSRLKNLILAGIVLVATAMAAKEFLNNRERSYLSEAFEIVRNNSVRRNDVDWDVIRRDAFTRNRAALTRSETYAAIRGVLEALGDRHSGFLAPALVRSLRERKAIDNPLPSGRTIDQQIGYLKVPAFVGLDRQTVDAGAARIAAAVRSVQAAPLCGWIIDLRSNAGGNMWPMLAGVGAVLGEGVVGAFVDPSGQRTEWSYRNGAALEGTNERARALGVGDSIPPELPVAVLLGRGTASSAEALAIAFLGRANTRTFGDRTLGLTTSNEQFELSDGAVINLVSQSLRTAAAGRTPTGFPPMWSSHQA